MVRLCYQGTPLLHGGLSPCFFISRFNPTRASLVLLLAILPACFTPFIYYYLSVQHIHPTISKHLSSSGILVLILINMNEVSGITCIGTVFFLDGTTYWLSS